MPVCAPAAGSWPRLRRQDERSQKRPAGIEPPARRRAPAVFDVVVVYKLDRFGRSVAQVVENVQMLDSLGVRFSAVTQGIDTDQSNPPSRLLLHVFAAFAEFERELIKERVQAGMKAAKKAGKSFRRPKLIFTRRCT